MIHVALAFCDPKGTYARHAAVTMASIYANTDDNVCIHIIHDDTLTKSNRDKLDMLAGRYAKQIDFINVEAMFKNNSGIDVSKLTIDGARGTLFRLLIPDIIFADKIIYLDCDIVVNMDIAELWNVPIGGDNAVAVVPDVWSLEYLEGKPLPKRLDAVWNLFGVARGEYFNSGVMLMNLRKFREKYDFLSAVEKFFVEYKKCITLPDQDCLNQIFANDKLLVDERFNRIRTDGIDGEEKLRGSIWHMAGGGAAKPWVSCTRPLVDDLYWRYLRLTPYCPDDNTLIRLMLNDLSSPSYMHRHSSQCIKRLCKQQADNIFRGHIWTVPHIYWKRFINKR